MGVLHGRLNLVVHGLVQALAQFVQLEAPGQLAQFLELRGGGRQVALELVEQFEYAAHIP